MPCLLTWWLWCPCACVSGLVQHCHLTVVACPLQLLLLVKGLDHLVQGVLQRITVWRFVGVTKSWFVWYGESIADLCSAD